MNISARNVFRGKIVSVVRGAVNAEVRIALHGGIELCSIITIGSAEKLGLRTEMPAYAIIKATSVILGTNLHDARLSARNILCGTITRVLDGPVSAEVEIAVGAGNTLSAVITHESARKLGLEEGGHACAIFKASSVIIGVEEAMPSS
jgi:molybdate transport system regulatory protein